MRKGFPYVAVEGGHGARPDLAPEPGAEDHIGAGVKRAEEVWDLKEVIGVVRVSDDDIPPPGACEPREVGVAVAPLLRPDDRGTEGLGRSPPSGRLMSRR